MNEDYLSRIAVALEKLVSKIDKQNSQIEIIAESLQTTDPHGRPANIACAVKAVENAIFQNS